MAGKVKPFLLATPTARCRHLIVIYLDLRVITEELEGLVRSEKNALQGNLIVLLIHLLKCRYQPSRHTRSWDDTIAECRDRLSISLEDSPSLQNYLEAVFDKCYQKARKRASIQTGLYIGGFPKECPFSI